MVQRVIVLSPVEREVGRTGTIGLKGIVTGLPIEYEIAEPNTVHRVERIVVTSVAIKFHIRNMGARVLEEVISRVTCESDIEDVRGPIHEYISRVVWRCSRDRGKCERWLPEIRPIDRANRPRRNELQIIRSTCANIIDETIGASVSVHPNVAGACSDVA